MCFMLYLFNRPPPFGKLPPLKVSQFIPDFLITKCFAVGLQKLKYLVSR